MTITSQASAEAELDARCDRLLAEQPVATSDPVEFLGKQFDLGMAWVHFPEGLGGLGMSRDLQSVVRRRLLGAGAPDPRIRNFLGYGMGAATLLAHGTEEQKARFLRPLFTGEEIWCQLFSEPGAGSDLAGLATRAVRDGNEWVVNGQKVWTSMGHTARRGMLLARTDPDVPKHSGMTFFIADMRAQGVEVRPLMQMTGEAEFNEVFLADVRIADDDRVGDVGNGWRVGLTTLMNERVSIGGQVAARHTGMIGRALAEWRARGGADPTKRDALLRLWCESEVARLMNVRSSQRRDGQTPGPDGFIGKIVSADLNKRISHFILELMGPAGQLKPGGYPMKQPTHHDSSSWSAQQTFLRARANSIEGGTTEIAKNTLAERVLGLPGDLRTDKDVPWAAIPRS